MKYTRFILLFPFLCALSAHAVIGPELIKGFDELIAPQCKEKVSPVYAMGMLKSGTLANIRFWGNYGRIPEGEEGHHPTCAWAPRLPDPSNTGRFLAEKDPNECPLDHTSALIQSLFPSHAGVGLTANQGSKDDPLSQLTPENLGSLIELLQNWTIPPEGEADDAWILQVFRSLNLANEQAENGSRASLALIQSDCLKYHQDEKKISQLIENLITIPGIEIRTPQKQGGKKFNLEKSLSLLKETKRWKAIEPWAKILYKAMQESKKENYPYPPHTVERSLLSYLLMKEDGKEALLKFLSSTPSCLSPKGKELTQSLSSQAVAAEEGGEGTQKKLKEFLESRFQPSDYAQFSPHSHEGVESLHHDPERLGYFLYQSSSSDLPPLIGGQQAAHKSLGKAPGSLRKYQLYPDCGESSVRNFFNIIFYDKDSHSLKPEILAQMAKKHGLTPYRDVSKKGKPGQVGVEKGLLAFYTRNSDSSRIESDLVRDDWSRRVISGLPGVNYLKGEGQCEMNAGVDNALKVVGHLLGDPGIEGTEPVGSRSPGSRKVALDRLCQVVSREGFELSWKTESSSDPKNVDEKLIFMINGKPSFEWSFFLGHFSLDEIKDDSTQKAEWMNLVALEQNSQKVRNLWKSVKKDDYSKSQISDLWNQALGNSQVRLNLLDQVPWSESAGGIAHRFTRELDLRDEAVHRPVSVAAKSTRYKPLVEALSHAPEDIRARSAAYANDVLLLKKIPPEFFSRGDDQGSTPAHVAAENGHVEALKFIAEKAPDSFSRGDDQGSTPAHVAAERGHVEALKFIAEKDPDFLRVRDNRRKTPAHVAAKNGHVEALKFIAEKAPDSLSRRNNVGETLAHKAAHGGHVEALKFIAEKAPKTLMMFDTFGETVAYQAAEKNQLDVLRLIAEKAPESLEVGDQYGKTPAHVAAARGDVAALRVIAEKAPNSLSVADKDHQTALDSIRDQQLKKEIQEILDRHKK